MKNVRKLLSAALLATLAACAGSPTGPDADQGALQPSLNKTSSDSVAPAPPAGPKGDGVSTLSNGVVGPSGG